MGGRTPTATVGRFFIIHGGHGTISYNIFCRIFIDKPSERSKPGGGCVCNFVLFMLVMVRFHVYLWEKFEW